MEVQTFFKELPERDEKYKAFIRSKPCIVPGCTERRTVAHHQHKEGHGGKSTKCSDYRTLPVCFWHHVGGGTYKLPGAVHFDKGLSGWAFWRKYGIDVERKIELFNAEYQAEKLPM